MTDLMGALLIGVIGMLLAIIIGMASAINRLQAHNGCNIEAEDKIELEVFLDSI